MFKSISFVVLGLAGLVVSVWAIRYERRHATAHDSRRGFASWIRDLAYVDFVGAIGVYMWFGLCLALIVAGFRST